MATIVLTQVNEFTGERTKKVIESGAYDFVLHWQNRYVSVIPKGGKKISFHVTESLGDITKLINNAENPKLNQILENQKKIMENQKKILAMLEVIFEPEDP